MSIMFKWLVREGLHVCLAERVLYLCLQADHVLSEHISLVALVAQNRPISLASRSTAHAQEAAMQVVTQSGRVCLHLCVLLLLWLSLLYLKHMSVLCER